MAPRTLAAGAGLVKNALRENDAVRRRRDPPARFDGPGLREGEAAASFRQEEDRACAFDAGPVDGPLFPAEILRRPTLAEYASFLDAEYFKYGLGTTGDPDDAEPNGERNESRSERIASKSEVGAPFRRELAALVQACGRARDVARALRAPGWTRTWPGRAANYAPLHVAAAGDASEARKMAVAEALLGAGADARARTAAGTNAAHLAAARGERALLELLLVRGCDRAPRTETSRRSRTSRRVAARLARRRRRRWRARRCAREKAGSSRGTRGAAPPRTGPWRTARPTRCSRCGTPARACARSPRASRRRRR